MTMSLADLHLADVPDLTILPTGEYQLKITKAWMEKSKSSERNLLKVSFNVIDHPEAFGIFTHFNMPIKGDKPEVVLNWKRELKDFMLSFGLDLEAPGEPADWNGLEGWVFLKETVNNQDRQINEISRYILPR